MAANVGALTVIAPHTGPARGLRLVEGSDHAAGTIRVAVADGQRLLRAGVRVLLEREPGIAVVGEAATGEEAIALAQRTRPDVVLSVRAPAAAIASNLCGRRIECSPQR